MSDGLEADVVFNTPCVGFGFDDLIALPGHAVCSASEVELSTLFSRNLPLNSPLVAGPMSGVTEGQLAISIALAGGIGIIHSDCSPEYQAAQVAMVKQFQNGFIMDPQVMSPTDTLADMEKLRQSKGITTAIITEGGKMGSKVLGIISSRDIDFLEDQNAKLSTVMTPKAKMVLGHEPITLSEACDKLRASKKGKLPIVNDGGELVAVVNRTDLRKHDQFPLAAKDPNRQLFVAAAVTPKSSEAARVKALVEAGVDALVLDAVQGDAARQLDFLKRVKSEYPTVDVVCGNVVTPKQAKPLLDAGADGLRVGSLAPSSGEAITVGRPQGSAVYHVARAAREAGVPVIADGGVRSSNHISMAVTLGASSVMCAPLLAGTTESGGAFFFAGGMRMKMPQPSDAAQALASAASQGRPSAPDSKSQGAAIDKGPAADLIANLHESVKRDLRRLGVSTISELHEGLYDSRIRFQTRSVGMAARAQLTLAKA
mmetsp:Transcript_57739/g.137436  ORF Transcript_57739/g.137436 Transcript_57739/m.137436 type:complete len:485 (-) Transcript_57739:80-1534(-)